MRDARFTQHLERMRAIHATKNQDYATAEDPYSNFKAAAATAGVSVDQVFATLIGVKLARLRELMDGRSPNHESVDDSLLDLSVYAALWASFRTQR